MLVPNNTTKKKAFITKIHYWTKFTRDGLHETYVFENRLLVKFNKVLAKYNVHILHISSMSPIGIVHAWRTVCFFHNLYVESFLRHFQDKENNNLTNYKLLPARLNRIKFKKPNKCVTHVHNTPANVSPALLQARAVIIMWELSKECTKLGGNALRCLDARTWWNVKCTQVMHTYGTDLSQQYINEQNQKNTMQDLILNRGNKG